MGVAFFVTGIQNKDIKNPEQDLGTDPIHSADGVVQETLVLCERYLEVESFLNRRKRILMRKPV